MNIYRCRVCGEVYIGKMKPHSCPFCGAHQNYLVAAEQWSLIKTGRVSDASEENLGRALELEINNVNFYRAASEKSKDVYYQSMFKGISKVENEHSCAICKHLGIAKPESDMGSAAAVDSDKENIEEANRREKRAVKFYGEALRQAIEPEIKEFFAALMQIESDHIVLTERMVKIKV